MQYTRAQLQQIADDAHDRIQETYTLFDIPGSPPIISAGIVKCVLESCASLAIPLIPPQPPLRLEPHGEPVDATPATHWSREDLENKVWEQPKPADQRGDILAFLRSIAVDGVLPTGTAYEAQRPKHLPNVNLVKRLFGISAWGDLAQHAELEPPQYQAARSAKRKRHANQYQTVDIDDAVLLNFLRDLSTDGTLPSAAQYDGARPSGYPSSATVTKQLGCRWTELAERTGLELSGRQRKASDARMEHLGAANADDAQFRHRNGNNGKPISDEARAVLGPEHVTVNGYKN